MTDMGHRKRDSTLRQDNRGREKKRKEANEE